ncbi:DUF3883 domain-containing protein [Micromonospora sp. KC207]|uniref:sacsin N-terminal ATP-binding-like domain-containing protein n=1 Tax=Micromonospora sp. KC207 TaxID=2530377 RepID=UPI00105051CE|nr:DUF3883 domain-containing protein [Micromonospora sp. KC207]TDC57279.1 DUF3883 domain-containing protein [Micromonospora sp. KC207]
MPTAQQFADEVHAYARAVVTEALGSSVWNPARQLRALTHRTTEEYAGRFLHELLQNAHDAHPPDCRDGICSIVLAEDEADFGVLYVGNAGNGFTPERLTAICKLADSAKVVGEGIGNKGVGFRSVLQITGDPQVFSSMEMPFDGYCFRFATGTGDLESILEDPSLAERALDELPELQVPVWIDDVPQLVEELGQAGHVTVLRLPLRSAAALDQVRLRLTELLRAPAPIMLFLERLAQLDIQHRRGGRIVDRCVLTRAERTLGSAGSISANGTASPELLQVDLGDKGEFLLVRGEVPHDRLHAAIEASISEERLGEAFREWRERAIVSVAVPGDIPVDGGQTYTFLPLAADARAPLPAHVNAPFFTKFDRTALDPHHPLNAMFLDVAAEVCISAAAALSDDHRDTRAAVCALVAWDPSEAARLAGASQAALGTALPQVPLVPVLSTKQWPDGLAPAEAAMRWPIRETSVATARAAASVSGRGVVDDTVGPPRLLDRMLALYQALGFDLRPSLDHLADVVERIVADLVLPADGGSIASWQALYADLSVLFADRPAVLHGRSILLAADGTLRAANGERTGEAPRTRDLPRDQRRRKRRAEQMAFFPPAGDDGDLHQGEHRDGPSVQIPKALERRLFFLHSGLSWVEQSRSLRVQSAARQFLERGLVRPFDGAGLLAHVKRTLQDSSDQQIWEQSLRFVFELHRKRPQTPTALADVGLCVRAASGWIKADTAVFGAGWHRTLGDDLAIVVAEGAPVDRDLADLARRTVVRPDHLLRRNDDIEEWTAFLRHLGVRDGLTPVAGQGADNMLEGWALTTDRLVAAAKVPDSVAAQWRPRIGRSPSAARHPYTPYSAPSVVYLPGQGTVQTLTESARMAYARLLLNGLETWPDKTLFTTWLRQRRGGDDPQKVITPVAAFVQHEPWIPARGSDRARQFQPLDEVWLPPDSEEEPSYVSVVDRQLRHLLDRPATRRRLRQFGIATWCGPEDPHWMLSELGEVVHAGLLRPEDIPAVRRAHEVAWRLLADRVTGDDDPFAETHVHLVVERAEALGTVAFGPPDDTVVYVTADRRDVTAGFIRVMGRPLVVVPNASEKVAELLRRHGTNVRHVDDAPLRILVDGRPLEPDMVTSDSSTGLVEDLPWLPLALAVVLDHRSPGGSPPVSMLTELNAAARAVRIERCESWAVTLDGEAVNLPSRPLVLPVHGQVVVLAPAGGLDWRSIATIAEPLCDLLGYSHLGPRLEVLAVRLERAHVPIDAPDDSDLAAALDLSPAQYEETRHRVNGDMDRIRWHCRPLLVHCLGEAVAGECLDEPANRPEDLAEILDRYRDRVPLSTEEIMEAARQARSLDEFRIACRLDFAAFNVTLSNLGSGYEPISRAEAHQEALQTFLLTNKTQLIDKLRWARLSEFDSRRPQPDWRELCDLSAIAPPEEWTYDVDVASTDMLDAIVTTELEKRLGCPLPASGESLPVLERLHELQRAVIKATTQSLIVLIRASGRPLPRALAATEPVDAVQRTLDEAGALDFRPLTADDIVSWLYHLSQWPAGMPLSADYRVHGLSESDLSKGRSAEARAREEKARLRRVLAVAGREVDVENELDQFIDIIRTSVDSDERLRRQRDTFAELDVLPAYGMRARNGAGNAGGFVGGRRSPSDVQRNALGAAGEYVAWHWLKLQYSAADESTWVSANRRHFLVGPLGDDSLGYDMVVHTGSRPLMFEVKAFQSQGGEIELGESEVAAARRYSDRWRLLLVTHVLEPDARHVFMLPNPFSKRGQGLFRELGGRLRYAYKLKGRL